MNPAPELSGGFAASMLLRMLRVPRPNSTIFRLTLALALLAWTALAFGAPATGVGAMQAPQSQAQIENAAPHCQDTMATSPRSRNVSTPMAQTGHGDCCQTTCRCLAAPTAVMTVPWVWVAFVPPAGHGSAGPKAPVPPAPAAPPLRPPIA